MKVERNMPMTGESGREITCYGEAPEKPGLYLALFHGRDGPEEQMDAWGFHGPLIGPLQCFQTTYATRLRILFESEDDELRHFTDSEFPRAREIDVVSDLVSYGAAYYGDWMVYVVQTDETANRDDMFRKATRRRSRSKMSFDSERLR